MPPPETYSLIGEIGSHARSILVHTSHYTRLENRPLLLTSTPPRKDYHIDYGLHVVPFTTHAHVRRKSIGKMKQGKERKRKQRKEKKAIKERK